VNTNRNWITRLLLCSHRITTVTRKTDMKINTSRKAGFTLVEIMIVVAIIGLLAAIAIPNFVRARETSRTNACINNLRQIDGAKQQWALETSAAPGATPVDADLYGAAAYIRTAPDCPAGGTYTIGTLATPPICGVAGHVLP